MNIKLETIHRTRAWFPDNPGMFQVVQIEKSKYRFRNFTPEDAVDAAIKLFTGRGNKIKDMYKRVEE